MKRIVLALVGIGALADTIATTAPVSGQSDDEAAPIYGVKLPQGYRDWHLISVKQLGRKKERPSSNRHLLRYVFIQGGSAEGRWQTK